MRITLGYHFDSGMYPDALGTADAAEGVLATGPLGIIGLLETRLGLPGATENQARRIAQCRRLMGELCGLGTPFYARSFAADNWATAKHILALRDELRLSGWNGVDPGGSTRLADLALLEEHLELAPGLAERLDNIFKWGRKYGFDGIAEVRLQEPEHNWPSAFTRLFALLRDQNVRLEQTPLLEAPIAAGDLGLLQNVLLAPGPRSRPLAFDGSLTCLRSQTIGEAAEALAAWLGADVSNNDILFLVQSNGGVLDNALHRHGQPKQGGGERSPWRAALQLLPLALATRWTPFDPHRMLEFLTAPLCPVHPAMARWLVRALEQSPGIGSAVWNQALDRCKQWAVGREDGRQLLDDLAFWTAGNREEPSGGMAADAIQNLCLRIAQWAGRGMLPEAVEILPTAASLAKELAEAVQDSGMSLIPKAQLDRMLDSVVGAGASTGNGAEASPWWKVSHPGQIRDHIDTIVWWNFCSDESAVPLPPWTQAESGSLKAAGVVLDDHLARRRLEVSAWKLPVLHARSRLVLVMPRRDQGEATGPHPFWEDIAAGLGLDESFHLPRLALEANQLRRRPTAHLLGRDIPVDEVETVGLPAAKDSWEVPPGSVPRREKESPSGMEKLIACPLSWALNYRLRIRPGKVLALPEGNRLKGNFCHALINMLLTEGVRLPPKDAAKRALELFDANLEKLAAPFLLPGMGGDRLELRRRFEQAVQGLFERLQRLGLTVDGSEREIERVDEKGQLFGGVMDLLLRDKAGHPMVWDLKWSSRSNYRREEMKEGLALQLAAYCWMLASDEVPARAAYFMLAQNELIAPPDPALPAEETVDVDLRKVWEDAHAAYEKRLAEIAGGNIAAEIPREGDEAGGGFRIKPKCTFCDYGAICGVRYES